MKDIYAYPTMYNVVHQTEWETHEGMSLLDYFAGQALMSMNYGINELDIVVHKCYKMTEAMLVEREKYNKR